MIRSAVTISLVPEARGGPFVFWDGLAAGCAEAARLGFDAVEIFPRSAGELDAAELRQLLDEHQLQVAAIGTGAGWVAHKLRLTDPDAAVREKAREFVEQIIDFAAEFGAPAIIGSMQGRADAPVTREQALGWLGEALETLGERAGAKGQTLIFEPLNRYETNLVNTATDGVALIENLRTPHVRLLADCFHMNIEERSIPGAIAASGARIGHVHLADSNRRAAGFGHTDFESVADVLGVIGYSGYLSAEILPLPDSTAAAEQTMRAFRQYFPR